MLPSESIFLQYFPSSVIESARPFTPFILETEDDVDTSRFIDGNNNSCPIVGTISKITAENWKKGSVPDQIHRVWNKRRKSRANSENGMLWKCVLFVQANFISQVIRQKQMDFRKMGTRSNGKAFED